MKKAMRAKPIRAWAVIESKGFDGRKGRGLKTGQGPSICWRKFNAEYRASRNYSTAKFEVIEVEIRPLTPKTRRRMR